jgi:acyl-CoA reductase-like NAD-dependent aldehyde dehydrogenase
MVIGGEAVDAAEGQTFDVVDPATGSVIATVPWAAAGTSTGP